MYINTLKPYAASTHLRKTFVVSSSLQIPLVSYQHTAYLPSIKLHLKVLILNTKTLMSRNKYLTDKMTRTRSEVVYNILNDMLVHLINTIVHRRCTSKMMHFENDIV